MGSRPGRDQRDTGRGDRQDLDDAGDEVIEDPLNREIGDQRACELTEHCGEVVSLTMSTVPNSLQTAGRGRFGRDAQIPP